MAKKMQMIHLFETTSPYDFIASKYKTGTPTSSDLNVISYLLLDLDLKPGVVNVLVDYVLKINNNNLTKRFVETIAAQWKKSNIETVEDAMNIAEEEYKKRKNIAVKKEVRKDKKPEWYQKEIEADLATAEEIEALEKMLKG